GRAGDEHGGHVCAPERRARRPRKSGLRAVRHGCARSVHLDGNEAQGDRRFRATHRRPRAACLDNARRKGGAKPMTRLAFTLLLAGSVTACTGDGSAEYAELAIGIAEPVLDAECVPLPLLPGSKIIEDLELG